MDKKKKILSSSCPRILASSNHLILGIDPGLQRTGWGIIHSRGSSLKFIACGVIKTSSSASLDERLKSIHDGIRKVADMYCPSESAIEETFVSVNGASTLKLGQARGAAMLSLSLCGLPVSEYSATSIKKAVVGNGHAEKKQVEAMMKILLPGANPEMADAADALAVAVCHANSRSITRLSDDPITQGIESSNHRIIGSSK